MSAMSITVRTYEPNDEVALVQLWRLCGLTRPWNDPNADIYRKLDGQSDWLLVAVSERQLVGSVMVGYDGHRGWINYLAVAPDHQQTGIGRMLMTDAESRLRRIGCPKINLQVRGSNHDAIAFYEAIGFQQDDVVSFGKRLVQDEHPLRPDES